MTRFSPDTRVRVVKDLLSAPDSGIDWTGREGFVVPDEHDSRTAVRLDGMKTPLCFDDDELEAVDAR